VTRARRRRWRLRAACGTILLAVAGCLTGCGTDRPTVTILGPWVDKEGEDFQSVLEKSGLPYRYQGSRAVGQVLQADLQKGTLPDIVVLPSLGELASYIDAGAVYPLDDVIGGQQAAYGQPWLPKVARRKQEQHYYWVPIKANLKSIVWYNRRTGFRPPATWRDAAGRPWCMGMGDPPNSGWPATDWIEDILLHQSGTQVYEDWVAGRLRWDSKEVEKAWKRWGELNGPGPGPALLTSFGDAGHGLFGSPPSCDLEHQASFIMGFYQAYGLATARPLTPGTDYDFRPLPGFPAPADGSVWEVSADVAALLGDSAPARELIRWLATPQAQGIWPGIAGSGAFSVNSQVPVPDGDPVTQQIATKLRSTAKFCLDGADLMPAEMRDAFYRGALEYLSKPDRLSDILARLDEVSGRSQRNWRAPACGH